ncbi:MAG: CAP domain-containing protein [Brevundimonas sp.]|uniref:CAP domain-containing protein n=1 Tax=Brevundimonas sp. TaxID=1871086 RepID=UPI0040341707
MKVGVLSLCGCIALAAIGALARPAEGRETHRPAAPTADGTPRVMTGPGPVGGDAWLAREVLDEMNRLRTDPGAYVAVLQEYRAQFQGDQVIRPGRVTIQTLEGVAAVDEAIRFLRRQPPLPPLRLDPVLERAARDHVVDQGPTGFIGHYGSDGRDFAARIARRGGDPYGGENISYGYDTAREVVIQLLVDDNVRGRGHRANLFRSDYVRAGVGCGPHAMFYYMCVIDYGYEPVERD